MPELPEVETIRRDLKKYIINKPIRKTVVSKEKIIRSSVDKFSQTLKNNKFKKIDRIGKLLIITINNNNFLLIHLKMTGQLIYLDREKIISGGHNFPLINKLPNKYTHAIIYFKDQSVLFYNDLRQFGYLKIVSKHELDKIKESYGIEPLKPNFKFDIFCKIFTNRRTSLKSVLLNQKIIAGLGNIYVDEICHDSGIRPSRKANSLSKTELKKLFLSSQKIIKSAIKYRGTTFNNYRDSQGMKGNFSQKLKVYGLKDKICQTCQKFKIKKIKISGRGTHFCPNCQK